LRFSVIRRQLLCVIDLWEESKTRKQRFWFFETRPQMFWFLKQGSRSLSFVDFSKRSEPLPYSSEDVEKLKRAPATPGVLDAILKRWSPRAYRDKAVSSADLKMIFEAAHWAASSSNEQPWRFMVGRKGDSTYQKIFDSLVEGNKVWAGSAPVLILSVGKKTFSSNGAADRYGLHDTGAATAYLALQATALGMHTHSMGGFDNEKARAAFDIPDDFEIGAVTTLGYSGDPEALPAQLKERELARRERKPLAEVVFAEWGKAAAL
jgi:nitroreductase